MKYLVCGLDDEHYTCPEYLAADSFIEATEIRDRWCLEFADGNDYTTEIFNNYSEKIVSYIDNYDNERFYVSQIKEIEYYTECMVVWHHAYNGVDFDIEFYGSFAECCEWIENKAKEVDDIVLWTKDELIIDTGDEWEMWTLVWKEM